MKRKPASKSPKTKLPKTESQRARITKVKLKELLLKEFGPPITPYFGRPSGELETVLSMAQTLPYVHDSQSDEIATHFRRSGIPADTVNFIVSNLTGAGYRNGWGALLFRKWRDEDAGFFELLSVVLKNRPTKTSKLHEAARTYISKRKRPTAHGFLGWIQTERDFLVTGSPLAEWAMEAVHPQEALRAFHFVSSKPGQTSGPPGSPTE